MISKRALFLSKVAQTSPLPMGLEVVRAQGVHLYDVSGKMYWDLNSGISVSSLGHRHPRVTQAVESQMDKYWHTMVYGEHIQSPQVEFADLLLDHLDNYFGAVYYLMSGTEATELAMKLAKRATGRTEIVAARNAYHGSTQGAESLQSDASYKAAFLPLLPDIRHIDFNHFPDLDTITTRTAGVVIEAVQAEAGVCLPVNNYLKALRERCSEVGAVLILDEIQTGFGRTGALFAHQKYGIVPDIMLIGKAMGGGMPIAAVVSSREMLNTLTYQPALGHITTFGGHPISVAAAHATLYTLIDEKIVDAVQRKSDMIYELLHDHPIIKEVRRAGLMMAVELKRRKYLKHVVAEAFRQGAIIDWFLFNNRSFRLAPPLIITEEEIVQACGILRAALDYAEQYYVRKQ